MKKKLLVLIGVVVLVGVLGKTLLANASLGHSVNESWEIQEKEISAIEVVGCPQNVNVTIAESDEPTTKVQVTGKISQKCAKELATVKFDDGKLRLVLGSTGLVAVTVIPDEAEAVTVTIQLGKDAQVANYLIDTAAAAHVKIPKSYQGSFDLDTNNKGTIVKPQTKATQAATIKISAIGDIDVVK
ncbi:hypothetical protein M2139_002798 [Enterococcus sp. PF1-24]|uniref:hypothetical protein n=1 Tax=unclassified Enterococcus TaxID=2608891 RepID=UPI002476686D|nr:MULTISPECIES: hypothetical protein [unclassified Enterococcus]MDH6365768.1 hypothetical protein [Enterococcus sp. PFB1-1]MDH6402868.1 hypothetical protein [Enterococcus sp. PF1-24]